MRKSYHVERYLRDADRVAMRRSYYLERPYEDKGREVRRAVNQLTPTKIILTYLCFVILWAMLESDGPPFKMLIKLVLLLGFPLFFIYHYNRSLSIKSRELFAAKFKAKVFFQVSAAFLAVHLARNLLVKGGMTPSPIVQTGRWVSMLLVVAMAEELAFRGWFFNALGTFLTDKSANMVVSFFFALAHNLFWVMRLGEAEPAAILRSFAAAFALSYTLGWVFSKNKALLEVALLRGVWVMLSAIVP